MRDSYRTELILFVGIAIILAIVVAIMILLIKKSIFSKKLLIVAGATIAIIAIGCYIAVCLSAANNITSRIYKDDIIIQMEDRQAEIIIREWTYLLASGAEVYYKKDGKEVKIGQLLGGDDGFCPFEAGLYSVDIDENKLIIEWCRFSNGEYDSKKVLDIPGN